MSQECCENCSKDLTKDSYYCEECKNYYCEECSFVEEECNNCSISHCVDCMTECELCHEYSCKDCIETAWVEGQKKRVCKTCCE